MSKANAKIGSSRIGSSKWQYLGIIPIRKKKVKAIEFVVEPPRVVGYANDLAYGVIYPNGGSTLFALPKKWIGKKFREVLEDE